MTNKTKMTKQATFIPNSIPLDLVVQIPYIMAMSYYRTPGTFFFEVSNITNFFI